MDDQSTNKRKNVEDSYESQTKKKKKKKEKNVAKEEKKDSTDTEMETIGTESIIDKTVMTIIFFSGKG